MALKKSSPKIADLALFTIEEPLPRRSARSRRSGRRSTNLSLLLMAVPGIVVLLVMAYIPMAGVLIAFKNYLPFEGFFGSAWVGLENFRFLFSTDETRIITYNTLFMNSLFIIFGTGFSLAIALLLNQVRDRSRFKFLPKIYQSVIFFPYLISYVLVSYFVLAMFNYDDGTINHVLIVLHLQPIDWYGSPQYWPVILTLTYLWKNAGFTAIIYLAGMVAISPEYYEAARLDGASGWQQVWYITLPLIKPLIILTVLLAIGRIFYADFGLFFQVTNNRSALYPTTDVIDTYVYRALITLDNVGMSSAAGLYQSAIGFFLIFTANWFVRRIDPDQAAF
ncbi:MAG TPA: ABC transporter permease subunit [Ktedonobacteraceae bacterium]